MDERRRAAGPARNRRDRRARLAGHGGYYRDPAATAEAAAYGWHHTGDIGYLDEDDYLFIVDRAKDMVITGGFNVYSTEVEQAILLATPRYRIARSSGCPTRSGASGSPPSCSRAPARLLSRRKVGAFVRERIGGVKAPKQVEVWPDLPRSKVGKVLKRDIKAQLKGTGDAPRP